MSQRHPGARRASQGSQDQADDVFVARVLEASNWAQGNQQVLTVALVVVAILVAGGLYYRSYRAQMNVQAADQLEGIHQSIALGDVEGAKIDLATFMDRFGSTAYTGEARLMLGELYLETGSPQQALAVLEPIGASPGDPIEFQAAALLAAAYEQEERWDDAVRTWLRIADRSELDFQVRSARMSAARIHAEQGDVEAAVSLYEEILQELEANAPERGTYEMRIEELRARAG